MLLIVAYHFIRSDTFRIPLTLGMELQALSNHTLICVKLAIVRCAGL